MADDAKKTNVFPFWAWPLLPAAVLIGAHAFLFRAYVMDDAYIGFRYVDNLISGNGFVFNPGEYVEGVTNVGWLLVLTPFAFFCNVAMVAKVAGLVFLLGAVYVAFLLARRLENPAGGLFSAGVALLTASQFDLSFFSLIGMETGLLALLLCGMVWWNERRLLFAALSALAFLVHPECVLIWPIAAALSVVFRLDSWKRYVAPGGVFFGVLAAITVCRYLYFGDVLPNTFAAKPPNTQSILEMVRGLALSRTVNLCWPMKGLVVVPLMGYGWFCIRRQSPRIAVALGAMVAAGMFFSLYAMPDWTGLGRYSAPYVPVALLLFWRGAVSFLEALGRRFSGIRPALVTLVGLAGLLCMDGAETYNHIRPAFTGCYPGYVITATELTGPAIQLGAALPADAVIATRRIGALAYYSKRRVFDYCFGLTNRGVARQVHRYRRDFDSPAAAELSDIWPHVSPDYLLEDRERVEETVRNVGGTMDAFSIHGVAYRLLRTFPLGDNGQWLLCGKIE